MTVKIKVMNTIRSHVTYTCKKVSKDLWQYNYDVAMFNEKQTSFDVIYGKREFSNYSEFMNHCKEHVCIFYGVKLQETNIIESAWCFSSVKELTEIQ